MRRIRDTKHMMMMMMMALLHAPALSRLPLAQSFAFNLVAICSFLVPRLAFVIVHGGA